MKKRISITNISIILGLSTCCFSKFMYSDLQENQKLDEMLSDCLVTFINLCKYVSLLDDLKQYIL